MGWAYRVNNTGVVSYRLTTSGQVAQGETYVEEFSLIPDSVLVPVKSAEQIKREKDVRVTAERDRRISSGVLFQGVLFQSRATDRENIAGAAQLALMATLRGDGAAGNYRWHGGDEDFVWIAEDNSLVRMDAPTVIAFAKTAAAAKQAYTMIARSLKDLDPAPDDITDDALWQL